MKIKSYLLETWLHIHSVRQFQFHPSVIQQYAFSRSRLLGFTGVKIPIFPSLPLNPCILMRIDLVSSKTLKH